MDIGKLPPNKLPVNELTRLVRELSAHYRCKMGRTWILNTTSMQKAIWNMISSVLEKATKDKIHITDKNIDPDMNDYFHLSQIPEKYGG